MFPPQSYWGNQLHVKGVRVYQSLNIVFSGGGARGKKATTQPGGENYSYEGEIMYYWNDLVVSGLT